MKRIKIGLEEASFGLVAYGDKEFVEQELMTSDRGTMDELGLGVIGEIFSDVFFPAISTNMRSSKYLIFLPQTINIIEKERRIKIISNPKKKLKELEIKLIKNLRISDKNRKKEDKDTKARYHGKNRQILKAYPSAIYWTALWKLKIIDEISVGHFISTMKYDEKQPSVIFEKGKVAEKTFIKYADTKLSLEERQYIKNRFNEVFPESLMSFLMNKKSYQKIRYPWDVKGIRRDKNFAEFIHHAEILSYFSRGLRVKYWSIKSSEKKSKKMIKYSENCEEFLKNTWGSDNIMLGKLNRWNIDDMDKFVEPDRLTKYNISKSGNWEEAMKFLKMAYNIYRKNNSLNSSEMRGVLGQGRQDWKKSKSIDPKIFEFDYKTDVGDTFIEEVVKYG